VSALTSSIDLNLTRRFLSLVSSPRATSLLLSGSSVSTLTFAIDLNLVRRILFLVDGPRAISVAPG
jgi:hypothetical protein